MLRLYERERLSRRDTPTIQAPTAPGQVVRLRGLGEGASWGIIIACDVEHASVLWSVPPASSRNPDPFEPSHIFAPHVPLQVTPSIFREKP